MNTVLLPSGSRPALALLALALATAAVQPVVVQPVAGQRPVPSTGLEIMQEVDLRSRGWGDMEAELRMEIHDDGDLRLRVLDVKLLEAEDGDRTLLVLKEPRDLTGTAFLSIRRPGGDRAGWMSLPSQRRPRRIGDARGSDAFLGSHLTYADLDPPSLDGYDFRVVSEEEIAGAAGVVVERTVAGRESGPRELVWVDTRDFLVHRVEFYGADGALDRSLVIDSYQTVAGFPRPARLEMRQAEGTGRTVLEWRDIQIDVGLSERDFDPGRLGG
jgi:hypothetical protein